MKKTVLYFFAFFFLCVGTFDSFAARTAFFQNNARHSGFRVREANLWAYSDLFEFNTKQGNFFGLSDLFTFDTQSESFFGFSGLFTFNTALNQITGTSQPFVFNTRVQEITGYSELFSFNTLSNTIIGYSEAFVFNTLEPAITGHSGLFTFNTTSNEIIGISEPFVFNTLAQPEYFEVTVQIHPEGAGQVTGTGTFLPGAEVTLVAYPNEDYVFESWSDGSGEELSDQATYVFIMPETDVALSANFFTDVSVADLNTNTIRIFPNPAGERIFIESERMIQRILVFDASGRLLENIKVQDYQTELLTAHYREGTYIIRVHSDLGVLTRQIIIVK
ncbi:MAG: T9SS type A sorting domain-containing protein [Bacteroidales bacterium]|jgi:hypothetical protein|nr:T9SS type A sorting domain-containing protein [Bacteroidales bacterium]NLM92110.1 T9SS type A sorting domain-containing protein [Bacteroidales bacterium]